MSLGYLVHPTSTARRGRGYPNLGLKKDDDLKDDGNLVLCAQCGFPNDKTQITQANGKESEGLQRTTTAVSLQAGGTTDVIEMIRVAGCRFCGSMDHRGFNRFLTRRKATSTWRR